MPELPSDDLFAPTLTEDDDALDFDRPWNPWSLVILTFFFGLVAGGTLLALNFRKLGLRQSVAPTLGLVLVVAFLLAAASAGLIAASAGGQAHPGLRAGFRFLVPAVNAGIAMVIAAGQQKRFRLFQASGGPPGKLLWPAVGAAAASIAFELVVRLAVLLLISLSRT